jgi:ubiquinone/menaquinone biosynthesis C-methylase UbiE
MLTVGMAGVKMGDRVLHLGCENGPRMAAVAVKVGLSGRAAAFVPDEKAAERARKGAEQEGALVEIEVVSPTRLPADDGAFDLVIVDDTGGLLATLTPDQRRRTIQEVLRVLRPGGRMMVISATPRSGLAALFVRVRPMPAFELEPALQADGFRLVRQLGEREGLRFTEGLKPR